MKMRWWSFLLIILAAAVVGSCSSGGREEETVLNFALSGNPDTLDPHKTAGTLTFQTLRSVYDTLVEPDPSGRIVPALAEDWAVSDDFLTWTFSLRKGVVFHNGEGLTSKDVKATIERLQSKQIASPKADEFAAVAGIETPDDSTVVIRLSQYVPLLASLASGWGAILPKSLIDSGHDFGSAPVGTGPYVMKEWIRDSKIELEKNKDYWMNGLPKLSGIIMHIIPEQVVQVQGLQSGQIDISYIIDSKDVPELERNPETKVETVLTSLVQVLAMNCGKDPLRDIRVRQAINHAIDKQKVLDIAYGGGMVVGTFMDYSSAYYKDFTHLYPYNPEKAKNLLSEAGIGSETVLEMALPQNYPAHVRAGEIYQEMLKQVGLEVKIRLVDWSTWVSDVYRGANYDLTVIGHTGKLDPDGRLGSYGTGKTYVRWDNPTAAALMEKARTRVGFDERKAIYDEALEIMAREVPQAYIGTSYRYIGMNAGVEGFRIDPVIDTFDFRWTVLNK